VSSIPDLTLLVELLGIR